MQATSNERKVIDIRDTVLENENIIPYILAAHAASGCDTVAPHHGIGKRTIIKKLREGFRLDLLGNFSASLDATINKVATLISSCCGYVTQEITQCRIQCWYSRSQKKCSGTENSTAD